MKKIITYILFVSGFASAAFSCTKQERSEPNLSEGRLMIRADLVGSSSWIGGSGDDRIVYGGGGETEGGKYIVTAQKEEWSVDTTAVEESPVSRGTPIASAAGIADMRVNIYRTLAANWSSGSALTAAVTGTKSGGGYTTSPTYNWEQDPTAKTSLFAYSPSPVSGNGLTDAGYKVSYTVPTDIKLQPDFCTATPHMNIVNSSGVEHTRSFELQHRLTAVGFRMLGWELKITSITVSGVSMAGTFDMSTSSWGSLTSTGSRDVGVTGASFSHSHNEPYADITQADGYLMMIPQTLTDDALVTINFSSTTPGDTGGSLIAKLKKLGVTWGAGDKVTYDIRLKTAPAVTSNELRIEDYRAGYTTSQPLTMVMDPKDKLTFSWDASWLKIHRGSPKVGDTNGGAVSPWSPGTGGPWTNIYFFATDNNSSSLAERTAEVTVTGTRSGTKTFIVKQAKASNPINPPSASDYVEINGLRWAKGNLIATSSTASNMNGCKVGAPSDAGVYFQFGSLIGWKGGAAANGGTGVGIPPDTWKRKSWNGAASFSWSNDAMVWPSDMTETPTAWPNNSGSSAGDRNTVVDQWFFNYNTAPYSTAGRDIRGFSGSFAGDKGSGNLGTGRYAKWGIGDPCTYYLGGTWRLPTTNEFKALCNNQGGSFWLPWATVGGSWTNSPTRGGNFSSNRLFFPISGDRNTSTGLLDDLTAFGTCWSSSVTEAKYGDGLLLSEPHGVVPQNYSNRSSGFPVRCVSKVP